MEKIIFQGQEFNWGEGQSLLESLEDEGVEIPSSCRVGACHSCLIKVKKGPVPSEAQKGLKDTWVSQGLALACLCKTPQNIEVAIADSEVLTVTAQVVEKNCLTSDVVIVRLKPEKEFPFRAGQFVQLIRQDGLTRPYSIASIPTDGFIELHIRKVKDGRMSSWLYDVCAIGERLEIRGPNGDCIYAENKPNDPLLLIGTGTGLAPLLGVLREALTHHHRGPITLIHGGRDRRSLYLHSELVGLSKSHSHFQYLASSLEPASEENYYTYKIDTLIRKKFPQLAQHKVYLCGDPNLVKSLKELVYQLGTDVNNILTDSFLSAPKPTPQRETNHVKVFAKKFKPKKNNRTPLLQKLRFSFQALVLSGFLLQGILYYTTKFRPLGNLLPFTAYDSLGHRVVSSGVLAWGSLFFLVAIFGRFVCGWLCPFGFLQDLGEKILRALKVRLPAPSAQPRTVRIVLAVLILGHFIVMPVLASPYKLWEFDLHFREPWLLGFPFHVGLFALDLALIFLTIGIVLPLIFGPRPYCKMVCETGMLLDQTSKWSWGKIRRNHGFDRNTCMSCQRCTTTCPQGINVYEEVHLFDRVVNSNCITCLRCVDSCPNDTIIYSLKKQMRDTGKIAAYLAREKWRPERLPRHALTGAGVLIGAVIGFFYFPPSYFHTYLLFSSLGGLGGWILWKLLATSVGGIFDEDRIKKSSLSRVELDHEQRLLPLTNIEKLNVETKVKTNRWLLPVAMVCFALLGTAGFYIAKHVPPRISTLSNMDQRFFTPSARDEAGLIYIGVPPIADVEQVQRQIAYNALSKYLHSVVGRKFVFFNSSDYGELSYAVESDQTDLAVLPPIAYAGIHHRHKGKFPILARLEGSDSRKYDALIISRADSSIQTLEELQGKRIALGQVNSLSGYVVPVRYLHEHGLSPLDFASMRITRSHQEALSALANGEVDATTTYERILKKFQSAHPQLKLNILARIPLSASNVVVANPAFDESLRGAIQKALYSVNSLGATHPLKLALKPINFKGFGPFDSKELDYLQHYLH